MSINDRISLLINELGLNNNSFAKTLDVSPTVTFNIISGRNTKPSYELLEKIAFTYDNINTEWLIRGNGNIFLTKSNTNNTQKPNIQTKNIINVTHTLHNRTRKDEIESDMIKFLQQQVNDMITLNKDLTKIILNLSDKRQQESEQDHFFEKKSR